jgi:hypothetical protein
MVWTDVCVALDFFLQIGFIEFALQKVETFQRLAEIPV